MIHRGRAAPSNTSVAALALAVGLISLIGLFVSSRVDGRIADWAPGGAG